MDNFIGQQEQNDRNAIEHCVSSSPQKTYTPRLNVELFMR